MIFQSPDFEDAFKVIPVDKDIFIFVGGQRTGKSHFASSIKNAVVVDDVSVYNSGTKRIMDSLEKFKLGAVSKFSRNNAREAVYPPDSILIFVVNDRGTSEMVKMVTQECLTELRKFGGFNENKHI